MGKIILNEVISSYLISTHVNNHINGQVKTESEIEDCKKCNYCDEIPFCYTKTIDVLVDKINVEEYHLELRDLTKYNLSKHFMNINFTNDANVREKILEKRPV